MLSFLRKSGSSIPATCMFVVEYWAPALAVVLAPCCSDAGTPSMAEGTGAVGEVCASPSLCSRTPLCTGPPVNCTEALA